MKNLIEMDKLERAHYLKHYVGGFAMALDQHRTLTGQMEDVDIEDGSVLIKTGEESHWFDSSIVTPSLKKWKDLSNSDIRTIIDNLVYLGEKFDNVFISYIRHGQETIFVSFGVGATVVMIHKNWSITIESPGHVTKTPDNIGTIIFLLCELGYDVTEIFNK